MPHSSLQTHVVPLRWRAEGLELLDQRRLPQEEVYLLCQTVDEVAQAIRTLTVRGAPLIGIAAAYGMVVAARHVATHEELYAALDTLAGTRPTAVNLFWALARCQSVLDSQVDKLSLPWLAERLLDEARAIHQEDAEACYTMALAGVAVFPTQARVLTHCNAGALATGGIGTALGVIRAAHQDGRLLHVWVDETRPLLQGARLTAWELAKDEIPYKLICDNMAASLMASGQIDLVVVGADRITRNGDFANKIGTYGLAVLAQAHNIPFYVAAPWSTVDLALADGTAIPIEFRAAEEVCSFAGMRIAPLESPAWNPSFDVTPGRLVRGFISEQGVQHFPLSSVY